MKSLDIVIKQADKNLGVVAINGKIYRALRSKQLEPPAFMEVNIFPHKDLLRRLQNILKTGKIGEHLKQKWIEHAVDATEPCYFYIVPKLHKPTQGTRPITASHSYMLSPLSKQLARILQLKVDKINTIARDSKMFIQQLEDLYFNQPIEFITYDVDKLYPTINQKEAIKTLYERIPERRQNNGFWTKILQLIMFNNYVQAGPKIYRQMIGTATGTQVAPPFANLYLHFKMEKILSNPRILYQTRYIDDGFLIVKINTNAKALVKILQKATGHTFTFNQNPYQATYLDVTIYKGHRYTTLGTLDCKPYFKPTNKFLYLPAQSNHPMAHKKGIVKGEAIRCLRNSSDKTTWLESLNKIFKGLIQRGYKPTLIKKEWKKVRFHQREQYLINKEETYNRKGLIIKTRYHEQLHNIWKNIIQKRPLQSQILIQRKPGMFNKKQIHILKDWPPSIICHNFVKIGTRLISAKEQKIIDDKNTQNMLKKG